MSSPGVEPGLSRPRRDVLTTRRWGLACIGLWLPALELWHVQIRQFGMSAVVVLWPVFFCVTFAALFFDVAEAEGNMAEFFSARRFVF